MKIETVYTLADARKIIEAENRRKRYFRMQKLIGFFCVLFGVAVPLLIGDATISIFMIPLGLGVMFTKCPVICIGNYEEYYGG